jgi:DNA-binding beta-propeller fold protein YncE
MHPMGRPSCSRRDFSFTAARFPASGSGGDGIALSPDGTKMFVTVDHKSQLQVIATVSGTILATVPVPVGVSGERL